MNQKRFASSVPSADILHAVVCNPPMFYAYQKTVCLLRALIDVIHALCNFVSSVLAPIDVAQAVCNLVSCPDSQLAAVEAGAVPCLRQLAKLGVPEIEVSCHQEPQLSS